MVNDYLFQYDIDGGVCGMVPSAHAQLSSRRKVARTSLNYFLFSFLYKNYIRCKFLQIVFDEQYDCSPSGVYRCLCYINELEMIQKKITKKINDMEELDYHERLKKAKYVQP